jgi:hypothetical protein
MQTSTTTTYPSKERYTLGDFAKWFVEEYEHNITTAEYNKIAKRILWKINRMLIEYPIDFCPPGRVGMYVIKAIKVKESIKPIDWEEFNISRRIIKRRIKLSKGYTYRFRWLKSKNSTDFKNSNLYRFKLVQDPHNRMIGIRGLFAYVSKGMRDINAPNFERL